MKKSEFIKKSEELKDLLDAASDSIIAENDTNNIVISNGVIMVIENNRHAPIV